MSRNEICPLFSIIIPMYNVEDYLDKSIESILEQDNDDWEVILIDDGSTDRSVSIAQHYAQLNKNIKFFSQKNSGVSEARNYGIREAKGSYILFLDPDDYFDVKLLSVLKNQIIKFKNAQIFVFDYLEFDNNTEQKINASNFSTQSIRYGEVVWNKAYSRSLFEKNNVTFQKGMRYEDSALIHVIMGLTDEIKVLDFVGYFYRRNHSESYTSNVNFTNEINSRILALESFDTNILNYKDSLTERGIRNARFFLSLHWLYLFLSYCLVNQKDVSYHRIKKVIVSSKISNGFKDSIFIKERILYCIVRVSIFFRLKFVLKFIGRLRNNG